MSEGALYVKGDYVAIALDEPSVYKTFLGERKKEFFFPFISANEVQEVAEELLAQNRKLKVYYTCKIRGNPNLNLLDKCQLTAPKCSVSELECQIIRIDHFLAAGKLLTTIGLVAEITETVQIPYERLDVDNAVGTFSVGEEVEGQTSGATAIVKKVTENYLEIEERGVTNFEDDEQLVGAESGTTSDVDNPSGAVGLVRGGILHLDMDPPDHLDAGYYIDQSK